MKWFKENTVCLQTLTLCLNNVINKGEVPEDWKISKTVMVAKTNKPKVKEHRPIALANTNYKLTMNMIKGKILQHIKSLGEINVLQAGFTEGRRLEDNLFILNYCIENNRQRKQELVITAMDFEKVFHSVNRKKLIKVLKYYECDPRIIDVIVKVYINDKTQRGELGM